MKYVMVAAIVLLSACDKEYVCECRTRVNGKDGDTTLHTFRGSLPSAESSCVAIEKKKREQGILSATCEITKETGEN